MNNALLMSMARSWVTVITQLVHTPTWCTILGFSTKSSNTYTSTNISSIDAAMAFIDSLLPSDHINISKIAKQFDYNYSTLAKRYRGKTRSRYT